MELPEFSSQRKIERIGVGIVEEIVRTKLGWLFRRIPLEDDYGMDGYIDIVYDNKYVTGKFIGVQIKTGLSYFASESSASWTFYGSGKHIQYYLNLPHPVILILVNPDTQQCFWSLLNLNTIEKTENNWKVEVFKYNKLEDKALLAAIAGDVVDFSVQMENLKKIKQEMVESKLVCIAIEKSDIISRNYEPLTLLLQWITSSTLMIEQCRNKLLLSVFGYDDDPRELGEISAVRTWMKGSMDVFKYWGYFACMDKSVRNTSVIKVLFYCTSKFQIKRRNVKKQRLEIVRPSHTELESFQNQIFVGLNEFTERFGISEDVNFEQSMLIIQTLNDLSDKEIEEIRAKYK